MKKGMLITATVLFIVGIALLLGVFLSKGFDASIFETGSMETNAYTPEGDFDRIEIRSNAADIVFKPAADGKCRVVCIEQKKVQHKVSVENGTLTIGVLDSRGWLDHITFFSKSPTLTIYLPEDRYQSLLVDGSTGDLSVPDSFSFGSADIRLSTGEIDFGAAVEGLLEIQVTTGDTTLEHVQAKEIRITGSTGRISLNNTLASDSLSIDMTTGNVRLSRCDAEHIDIQTSTGDVSGTLLSGKIFSASSSTGKIRVPENGSSGSCTIRTSTGDIQITIEN